MSKKKLTDPAIRQTIYECASSPDDRDRLVFTGRASRDIIEARITKRGVCEAICEWIKAGKEIEEQLATDPPFKGMRFFIMDSVSIGGRKIYVKVQFMGEFISGGKMKIVSAHKPGRG